MNSNICIFGCGGHARSVADVALCSGWETIVFVDQNARFEEKIMGFPVINEYKIKKFDKSDFFIGIGDNNQRKLFYNQLLELNVSPVNIISPYAHISKFTKLGKGIFIGNYAHIGPETSIQNNTIINTHAVIEHECHIGCHVHIAIGALIAGRSDIGNSCFIGAGAVICDGKEIAKDTIVGAGGVVIKNIIEKGTYIGIPVKKKI